MASMSFQEKAFPYNYKQYERWCEEINIIESLTAVCGYLCRGEDTYINQTTKNQKQNYPEVRYAVHLVENHGLPKGTNYLRKFQTIFSSDKSVNKR